MNDITDMDKLEPDDDTVVIGQYAEEAYLSYAISVVKGRALPSVEDGQKPVQRRILYAMKEMNLVAGAKPVKSARVVGNVLGMYHPHGDSSAYEAAVRLAQDFTLRYPLIDGQGNFGSRDGDGAAAMRYTEMRLSPIADLLLSEIDRGTVDFQNNYDGAFQEPVLLPARLPMMLLNGASGIAVGMATEMVPHNMREVANGVLHVMANPNCTTTELMEHIPGPDWPGGSQLITKTSDIHEMYDTGRGSLRLRARWIVEPMARGQWRVIITELPHGVSVETIQNEILAISNPKPKKDKKTIDQDQLLLKQAALSMIDTVKSEGKKDVRLIIEPKTSRINSDEMMAFLLLNTSLEVSCSVNMVMIGTDGRPTQKNLLTTIKEWISFRLNVVQRRCQFDLDKINKRIHILEGRMIAFLNIDEVIKVIRNSDEPKEDLIKAFDLTDIQAEDILEIRLRQLARLEGIKIEKELEKLREDAEGLEAILGSNTKLKNLTAREIKQDAEKYGDDRRTLIEPVERSQASQKAFVVDEPVTILLSKNGWIRARQGHNVERDAITWKAGDNELAVIETRTVRPVVILDSNGRCYAFDASSVPGGKGDGIPVSAIIELQNGASITAAMSGDEEDKYLFTSSNSYGFIAPLKGLIARPKAGKTFMKVDDGAKVLEPIKLDNHAYLAATSSENKLLVFAIDEINEYPNGGRGVRIMDIPKGEILSSVSLCDGESTTVLVKGKEKLIKGDLFDKALSKRARKGTALVAAKPKSQRQKGLF
ncbi:MAG: DNA topoisomerase IV subunit A [Methylophilaceae bacterium]|nr:DNA topoisomerase IV subunit A [Methylophilaceae bacterium]MDG1454478.1 DNA topoisomerase IV subunit A [Methylophilaceae bacterium]